MSLRRRWAKDHGIIEPSFRDLVIDHPCRVDFSEIRALRRTWRSKSSGIVLVPILKWGMQASTGLESCRRAIGIVHQASEYLAKVCCTRKESSIPIPSRDRLAHDMINGIGIVGWGGAAIEDEAGMPRPAHIFPDARCCGVHLKGARNTAYTANRQG